MSKATFFILRSLRTQLTLAIVATVTGLLLLFALLVARDQQYEIEKNAYKEVMATGALVQSTLSRMFQHRNNAFIHDVLAELLIHAQVSHALVTDNQGKILFASHPYHIGNQISDEISGITAEEIKATAASGLSHYVYDQEGMRYLGYIPISVNNPESLENKRYLLILDFALAMSWYQAAKDRLVEITGVTLIVILFGFLLWYYLQQKITLPLTLLADTILKVGRGEHIGKIAINSHNEVGTLARAVEKMTADRLLFEERLRDSEARTRQLLEALPNLIWLKDANGIYLDCNARFELFFGAKRGEIIGKSDYDFIPAALADFFRENDKEAIISGKTWVNEEQVTFASDGHQELLETLKTPFYSAAGELIGVLGISRDITEQRRTEESLRRAQKMDALGQFTGGIAHDFNNILTVILGNVELLERSAGGDEKIGKRVAAIKKSAERAATLTRQLLNFSRKQATERTVSDLNAIIIEMKELITRSVTPEVEVALQLTDPLWLTEIDAGDFQDALLNLVINARDAMHGQGKLTLETMNSTLDSNYCIHHPGVTPGDYIELAVSDNGDGISLEHQEHIFEPFFTTKVLGKGTGLGLAMVFGFIKRSGGHINCYSESGIGTTFRLYLPRTQRQTVTDAATSATITAPSSNGETILAVDDEPYLLAIAKEWLEQQGYRVVTATNGQQALQLLTSELLIDLLFTDVVMPGGLNGYELAQQAVSKKPQLKVILTSGYTNKAISHSGQSLFTTGILTKPYTSAQLIQRVRAALEQ
ncbi:MAG: response regulator [Gammaproteobacteria bacterium]|nr:response regulator [Gammaproteobacteria bacterium]